MSSRFTRFLAASAVPILLGALAACGSSSERPSSDAEDTAAARTAFGPEGMAVQEGPLLATPRSTKEPVGDFACGRPDLTFHAHAHLSVYVEGKLRPVPSEIGSYKPIIEETQTGPLIKDAECFYNMHTHAQDGVIHFEAPQAPDYTLGDFFDIWGQPLSSSQVGPARGRVSVYVDGRPNVGDPRDIVLSEQRTIQLAVGKNVRPMPVDWSNF